MPNYCGQDFDIIKLLVENGLEYNKEHALAAALKCDNKDIANYLKEMDATR